MLASLGVLLEALEGDLGQTCRYLQSPTGGLSRGPGWVQTYQFFLCQIVQKTYEKNYAFLLTYFLKCGCQL